MGQVRNTVRIRKRDRILGRGVVRFLICESRIFTAKGGSVYFLKYLLKLQGLNNYNFFFLFVYKNVKFYHHSFQYPFPLVYAYLPHHGENFCTKKRRIGFSHLGIITLWVQSSPEQL